MRLHRLTIAFAVEQGPDPERLKWLRTWTASGTAFYKTVMPLAVYDVEEEGEGAGIVLAVGNGASGRRRLTVYFPTFYLPVTAGGDLPDAIHQLAASLTAQARRWAAHTLGYVLGDARYAGRPELATRDIGTRMLVPGIGKLRLTEQGDAWIDESQGEPELETRSPQTMQAWVDYKHEPEAVLAQILEAVKDLSARVDALEKLAGIRPWGA